MSLLCRKTKKKTKKKKKKKKKQEVAKVASLVEYGGEENIPNVSSPISRTALTYYL